MDLLGKTQQQTQLLGESSQDGGLLGGVMAFLQKPEIQAFAQASLPIAMGQGNYGDNAIASGFQGIHQYQAQQPEIRRQQRKDMIDQMLAESSMRKDTAHIQDLEFKRDLANKRFGLDNSKQARAMQDRQMLQNLIFGGGEPQQPKPQAYADESLQMSVMPDAQQNTPKQGQPNIDAIMRYGAMTGNGDLMKYGEYLGGQRELNKKARNRELAKQYSADSNISTIDEALGLVKNEGAGGGILGSASSFIPGTDTYDLEKLVTTLQANLSFDKLQEMRANSPTGGALGSVSERELELLGSTVANLTVGQSRGQLLNNINKVRDHYSRIMGYSGNNKSANDPLGLR